MEVDRKQLGQKLKRLNLLAVQYDMEISSILVDINIIIESSENQELRSIGEALYDKLASDDCKWRLIKRRCGALAMKSIIYTASRSQEAIVSEYSKKILEKSDSPKFDYYSVGFRRLRSEVFLRDGENCACCGAKPGPGVSVTIDHIKPVSKFPKLAMDINNLQVLCWDCNKKKSNKHFTDYRKAVK